MSKQNKTFVLTPVGTADYPHLNNPDYGNGKFTDTNGTYKVKLRIPHGDEASRLYDLVSMIARQAYDTAAVDAGNKGKRPPKRAELPIYDTGTEFVLTAKLRAKGVSKQNGVEKEFTQAPRLFDADGGLWDKNKLITHGSLLRLHCEVVTYDTPALGVGVSLRLKDAQVVELRTAPADSPFGKAPAAREEKPQFGVVPSSEAGSYDDGDF